jgi:hypothetical protein
MSERISFVLDGLGPEWSRTLIIDTADNTIFVASSSVTADPENIIHGNAIHANEPVIIKNDHVYVPTRWLAEQYPQSANICATLERRVRNHIAVDQQESKRAVLYKVRVQIAPIFCFECQKRIRVVRGYLYGSAFVALQDVSDTRQMACLIADLRKHDSTITPVSFGDGKVVGDHRFAARCPECSIICDNFFMTGEFFKENVQCGFPSCGCDHPNLQCRRFEYYPISLRLGPDELQYIASQSRAAAGTAGSRGAIVLLSEADRIQSPGLSASPLPASV